MAQGLMNLSNLLGQSSNATQGGLIGGGVFSQPMSRGQRRSKLLTDAIAGAGANPYARLGASFGGLIGMGARAGAEGLGIVDKPQEVQRAEAIRQVQEEVRQQGLDPMQNPGEFGETVSNRFQELGYPDLALRTQMQIRQMMPEQPEISNVRDIETEDRGTVTVGTLNNRLVELTADGPRAFRGERSAEQETERRIRLVGGTERAKALAKRYPDIGNIAEGQEAFLTLSNGQLTDIETRSAPEEETAPSRIREYELALERGLIDPNTSLEEYNQMRAGGGRSSVTPTETQLKPYAAVIDSNENLKERIASFVKDAPESTLLGLNIPFTGGRDQDAVDAVSLQAQQRAAEIRSDNAELTIEQALEQAIDELSQISGGPTSGGETSGGQAGIATPDNDPYAGRVNP